MAVVSIWGRGIYMEAWLLNMGVASTWCRDFYTWCVSYIHGRRFVYKDVTSVYGGVIFIYGHGY